MQQAAAKESFLALRRLISQTLDVTLIWYKYEGCGQKKGLASLVREGYK